MSETKTFIRYQNRNPKRPDVIYATLCTPQRTNNKKINNEKYLGRVINKENRIFYNKNDNYYQLSENNIKLDLSKKDLEFYKDADKCIGTKKGTVKKDKIYKNRQIIDFGASFTIYQSFKSHKFDTLFDFKSPQERDSLIALILFRIIEQKGYSSAYDWWSRDYIQYLCPYAKLKSQRISEFLAKIGTEKFFRDFFKNYIVFIKNLDNNSNILIDSTGLPNSIKCPYTAINNHNGKISKEIRLISVIDKVTGYPVYYRYVPGNIVDVKTLKNTIFELQEYGININRLILDAGYYSEENLKELYRLQIPFMTRMIPRYSIYDLLINKYAPNIIDHDNFIEYGSRNLFIKKVLIKLFDDQIPVFAYICSDPEKKINDEREYMHNYNHEKSTREKFNQDYLKFGIFIIISTIDLEINEILPCYYTRQAVEQFFDYLKNDIDLLPLRTHSEETFSGHLMLSFISAILFYSIDRILKHKGLYLSKSLDTLKILHSRIYNNKILPSCPTKKVNDIFKALKIKLPDYIKV